MGWVGLLGCLKFITKTTDFSGIGAGASLDLLLARLVHTLFTFGFRPMRLMSQLPNTARTHGKRGGTRARRTPAVRTPNARRTPAEGAPCPVSSANAHRKAGFGERPSWREGRPSSRQMGRWVDGDGFDGFELQPGRVTRRRRGPNSYVNATPRSEGVFGSWS